MDTSEKSAGPQMKSSSLKHLFILGLAVYLFGGAPAELGTEAAFFHGFMIPNPVVSVGLGTDLEDVLIRASSGMKIYFEVNAGSERKSMEADEARIKGGGRRLTEKFVILLAHAKEREEADTLAAGFRGRAVGRIYVEEKHVEGATAVFEVKLGDFLTRGEALEAVTRLKAAGMKDAWIVSEDIPGEPTRPVWMIVGNELKSLGRGSRLLFVPANPQSFLSVNGRGYRGLLEMKAGAKGTALVNLVNIEDYLKSVVPGELSPGQFNALEAHKAQAVAARTYALRNRGQFKALGFDLVSTPRSQLYMGMASEHPLSTRAVEETRGEVMRYRGELINAMYTSTCGGRTEDVEKVFAGRPVPYLKGVECTTEKQREWRLEARNPVAPIFVDGHNASLDVAVLLGLGLVPMGAEPLDFRKDASFDEAVEWIRDTRRLLGVKGQAFNPDASALDFVGLARLLIEGFGWKERTDELLLPGEVDFLLRDVPQVQGRDRRPVAYCFQAGLFPASVRTGDPRRPVSRAQLAMALARVVRDHGDFFKTGTFRAADKGTIDVGLDFDLKTLALSNHVRLLRTVEGETTFATKMILLGGESVRWLERDGQVAYLEVLYPPNGNALDRFSRLNRWQVRKTREELETRIGQSYPSIGGLLDVEVKSRGSSGRATEVLLKGTDGTAPVHGLQIRAALGLRDTLFVVDRSYDGEGRVAQFTFSGRGWGHGVGLCQVGAYGMALAGAGYQDILRKYYTGVKIVKDK